MPVVTIFELLRQAEERVWRVIEHPELPAGSNRRARRSDPLEQAPGSVTVRRTPGNRPACHDVHAGTGPVQQRGTFDCALSAANDGHAAAPESAEVVVLARMRGQRRRQLVELGRTMSVGTQAGGDHNGGADDGAPVFQRDSEAAGDPLY